MKKIDEEDRISEEPVVLGFTDIIEFDLIYVPYVDNVWSIYMRL
jgi:hypothetical protein